MSLPRFVFVETLLVGHSERLRKLQRKQVQSHAALVSARRITEDNEVGIFHLVDPVQLPPQGDPSLSLRAIPANPDVPENDRPALFVSPL